MKYQSKHALMVLRRCFELVVPTMGPRQPTCSDARELAHRKRAGDLGFADRERRLCARRHAEASQERPLRRPRRVWAEARAPTRHANAFAKQHVLGDPAGLAPDVAPIQAGRTLRSV
jgi:hypothetical protein